MDEATDLELRTVEHSIPLDVLSDLISRFIINVPESAKQNLIRICFQIELAYWYYLDFYVSNDSKLRSCTFKEFAAHVFQHLPFLQPHAGRLNVVLEEWREYKQSVPTYGAILLCEGNTHVLLVQSYWAKSSWGFPKGKVNEDEDPAHCAIREVYEETGFDITGFIDPENYFESVINEQLVRLYVITGISRSTKFQPRTRYEIKACEWFAVADLPNNKKDNTPKVKMGVNPNAFFMVLPFVKRIKGLLQTGKPKRQRHKSLSFSECDSTTKNKLKYSNQRSDSDEKFYKEENICKEEKVHKEEKMHKEEKLFKEEIPNKEEKKEKKLQSKRQLFNDSEEFIFSAPSWLNFKFDKAAILECIP